MDLTQFQSVDQMIFKLGMEPDKVSTRLLTEFCASGRFRLSLGDFDKQYVDGPDDGGIDFFHVDGKRLFVFQTKFCEKPKNVGLTEILHELKKIKNTLTGQNPNKKISDFITAMHASATDDYASLEIVWATTNHVPENVSVAVQDDLHSWRKSLGWKMTIEFIPHDYRELEGLIYDCQHGYVPYTGKRVLHVDPTECMELLNHGLGAQAVICTVNVRQILSWFPDSQSIDGFLQKNVRDFLGEAGKINREIATSYRSDPSWFWYKHNGIIMFADALALDRASGELVVRNPQVVNGGQTLKALYLAYMKDGKKDNDACILLRVYRLSHDFGPGYKRSLQIISALNTQNKINPSDLRSTDPRQVRLERLFPRIGSYRYARKRSADLKASANTVTMRNLAIRYHVCSKYAPHEGVEGKVEELFEEESRYNQIFDEGAINKDLGDNHIVCKYATCWSIDQSIKKIDFPTKKTNEFFPLLKWFLLADIYSKLWSWKQTRFGYNAAVWIQFLQSTPFQVALNRYSRTAVAKGAAMIPGYEEPRAFLKRKEAADRFKIQAGTKRFSAEMNAALKAFAKQYELMS